jgi:hypothetical protein
MGGGVSKSSSSSTIDISVLNKAVSNYLNQNSSSSTVQSNNFQNLKVTANNICAGCDLDASQTINSTVRAVAKLSADNVSAIKEAVINSANAQVDQASAAHTGAFALPIGGGSSATSSSNYKSDVKNIVENNMTVENVTKAYASAFNAQKNEININNCGDCSGGAGTTVAKMKVSQNIVSDVSAEAIVDTISKQLSDLDAKNTTDLKVKQDTKSYVAGLDDVIKSIGDLLSACGCAALAIYAGPILVCLIVCCSLCCSLLIGGVAAGSGAAPANGPANGSGNGSANGSGNGSANGSGKPVK